MNAGKGLVVGLVVLLGAATLYLGSRYVSESHRGGGNPLHLSAYFRDASGLVEKSRVEIAGIDVGTIWSRALEGRRAKVTVTVRSTIPIWSNAVIYKRSASLLGEYFLEIDPGSPTSVEADGRVVENRRLGDWDWITTVSEPVTTDQIIRQVSETVPVLEDSLKQIDVLLKGPINEFARDVDQTTRDLDDTIRANQRTLSEALRRIDEITANVEEATGGGTPKTIHEILDRTRDVVSQLDTAIQKADLPGTASSIRQAVDRISTSVDDVRHTLANVSQISDTVRSGQGTVGELLEDPDVARDVADAVSNTKELTGDAADFVHSITRFQTIVGLRTEYNWYERAAKSYVQLVLAPRPDKYYLIELVADPRGVFSNSTTISTTGGVTTTTATQQISDSFRFTFQFAKVIDFATFRFGIKESSGGLGLDLALSDRLALFSDLFDFGDEPNPRLKLMAAYRFFEQLYVVGGVDDMLNKTSADPFHPGRDYFAGLWLRFNDDDLKGLLTIGGSGLLTTGR